MTPRTIHYHRLRDPAAQPRYRPQRASSLNWCQIRAAADTSHTDGSVAAETRYTYRIKAINEHGVERAFALVPHRHASSASPCPANRPVRHGDP